MKDNPNNAKPTLTLEVRTIDAEFAAAKGAEIRARYPRIMEALRQSELEDERTGHQS